MKFFIERKLHIALGLCVVAIIVAAFAISISHDTYVATPTTTQPNASVPDPFDGLTLEAKAVYALDLSTGNVIFSKNPDEVLPLASLTKLVSALVAGENLPPETAVPIRVGDSNGLDPGETWSLDKLIDFTLVTSSNDGIDAIASVAGAMLATTTQNDPQQVFVDKMNETVQSLGLSDMRFFNPDGLDLSATTSGGYGSAQDVAALISYIYKNYPELLSATPNQRINISSNLVDHIATNTDQALPDIPGAIVSKTGNTDLAGGNLAVMFDAGLMHPVVIVLLGSSFDGRFTDMEALVKAATQAVSEERNTK